MCVSWLVYGRQRRTFESFVFSSHHVAPGELNSGHQDWVAGWTILMIPRTTFIVLRNNAKTLPETSFINHLWRHLNVGQTLRRLPGILPLTVNSPVCPLPSGRLFLWLTLVLLWLWWNKLLSWEACMVRNRQWFPSIKHRNWDPKFNHSLTEDWPPPSTPGQDLGKPDLEKYYGSQGKGTTALGKLSFKDIAQSI